MLNLAVLSNDSYQRPIGTLLGPVTLSEEAQKKAKTGEDKTVLDLAKIAKENPTPEQNVSSDSLEKKENPEEALDIPEVVNSVQKQNDSEEGISLQKKSEEDESSPKAIDGEKEAHSEKNNPDGLDDFVMVEKPQEDELDGLDAVTSSKSFLENEHIVNFCAFFNNILTSPPVVTFLVIAAFAGLFQCSLAGLAITSMTGTLAMMILWNCYPKVQTLAVLVGTFATVYFATQQPRHSAENLQQGPQAMGGVAQNLVPFAQAAFGGAQQPFSMASPPPQQQQPEQPARQPKNVPTHLSLVNHQLNVNPNGMIQGADTLTRVVAEAPRGLGTATKFAGGVLITGGLIYGMYRAYQWRQEQNANKRQDEENKEARNQPKPKKVENTSSNPSYLSSVGRGLASAGRGFAHEAGREVLLNAPGFIISSAIQGLF